MKTVSTALQTHIDSEKTTLAQCWKMTRRDSTVLAFTDHDQNIVYDGITYQAQGGMNSSAVVSQSSLAVDNLDIEGILSADSIKETDILAGLYDYSEIENFIINYEDKSQSAISLRKGWLGEIKIQNNQFVAEVRGFTQALSSHLGELYSSECRANFGDAECGYNLASVTVTGSVTAVADNSRFSDTSRAEANGHFNRGVLTFTSGANLGISREVKEFRNQEVVLSLPMPNEITLADNYTLIRGCDKSFNTCASTYSNAVNFRGEPHVPGLDKMLETAGTREGNG